jgi:hypothetical protein
MMPLSTPPEAKSFMMKAKAIALVIGALGTAATAIFGAVRKPEEKIAKEAYETLKQKVEKQDSSLQELHDDLLEVTGYLHALKDQAGVATAAPARVPTPITSAPVPQLPAVHMAPTPPALPPITTIISKAEAK